MALDNVIMPNPFLPQIKQLERKVGEFPAYDVRHATDEEKAEMWNVGATVELEKWTKTAEEVLVRS
jgi:hypothetical protein